MLFGILTWTRPNGQPPIESASSTQSVGWRESRRGGLFKGSLNAHPSASWDIASSAHDWLVDHLIRGHK